MCLVLSKMRKKLYGILTLVLMSAVAFGADFSGTYTNTEEGVTTTLTLSQTDNKITGTAKSEEGEFSINAEASETSFKGTATLATVGVKLFITGSLSGDNLTISLAADEQMTEAEKVVFKRVSQSGSKNESKSPLPKQDKGAFSKTAAEVLKSGKEYTHSSGGKLRYPSDWSIKEANDYVQLIPKDANEGEFIFVSAESAEGATDPGSAEVLAYLDAQVAQSIPDAKRSGAVEKAVAGAGKGVVVSWQGTVEGRNSFIRAYVTIINNKGVSLIAVGSKSDVESRDKVLRQIFQTIGWGQGKVDDRLVGTWNYWGYKGSSDGKYGREEQAKAVLNADGSFSYSNSSETNISAQGTDAGGNETWAGGLNSRNGNGWTGTWTADGSSIILNFADGTSETFDYRFEQQGENTFLVINPDDKKHRMEWSRG